MGAEQSQHLTWRTRYATRRTIRRSFPLAGLLLYYGAIVVVASVLIAFVPGFNEALIAPISEAAGGLSNVVTKGDAAKLPMPLSPWNGVFGRGALTLIAMAWALVVTLPVA